MADSRHRPRYHCCPAAAANQRHFRLHCGTRPPDIGAAAASDSAIRGCDGDDSAAGVGGAAVVVVVDFRSGCAVAVAVAGNSSHHNSGIR